MKRRNNMKRFLVLIALLLAACMLFSACDGAQAPKPEQTSATTVATTAPSAQDTALEGYTLNGHDLAEYAIVYSDDAPDYNQRAAVYLQSEILARTGLELTLVEEETAHEKPCELVVGETEREISAQLDATTSGTEFAILSTRDAIAMEGEYFVIAAAAYFFVETYIPATPFDVTVPTGVSIHEPIVKEAKNHIILIGDGMGLYQTLLFEVMENAAPYSDGEDFFYGYLLSGRGYSRTNSLSGTTDSAAGGTALSSGIKTTNGRVGQDADGNNVQNLSELALSLGKSAGVMSTETYTGATPSTFYGHAGDRNDTSDLVLENARFTKELGGRIDCGYDHYDEKGVAAIEKKVNQMLDKLDDNENGFFLMYEEAHIDKHCHNNDFERTALALARFNQVIGVIMEYAFYNPETFVLITADHETGNVRASTTERVFRYDSEDHSSQLVPVFAYGNGAALFDGEVVENVQIPQTVASFMGVTDFGDQSQYSYLKK